MSKIQNMISVVILTALAFLGFMALGPGQAVAQEEPCTVTIEKVAIPANDFNFNFSISGDIVGELNLSDPSNPSTFVGLGIEETITITENVPPGWELVSIECTEGVTNCGSDGFEPCLTATVEGNSVTFFCEDNDTASCTFTNGVAVSNIPTLSEWGLITMAVIIGAAGLFVALRRRKAAA